MKRLNEYVSEKLHVGKYQKSKDKTELKPSSPEAAHTMFDASMECENNQNIYKNYFNPLVQQLVKKKPEEIDLKKVEVSADVMDIAVKSLNAVKKRLDTDDKLLLCKYILSNVLKSMTAFDYTQTKEQEDYMMEWDYYDGPNKLTW